MIIFVHNGVKDDADSPLQEVWYKKGVVLPTGPYSPHSIRIYKDGASNRFSKAMNEAFYIKHQSDVLTEYCDNAYILIAPQHPRYNDILFAWKEQERLAKQRVS